MPPKKISSCNHDNLVFTPSSHASKAGYDHPTFAKRVAATTARGTVTIQRGKNAILDEEPKPSTFPAPLVLPGDDLAWDPTCPGQTFKSWSQLKVRNQVTSERRTIYFTGPPLIEPGVEYIQKWSHPRVKRGAKEKAVAFPKTEDVRSYLEAFYHGMLVKHLPSPQVCFTGDVDDENSLPPPPAAKIGKGAKSKVTNTASRTVWLNTQKSSGCIGIRTRATPKGEFTNQLNLNDLLDAAIEILPDDAYALLMLVEQDIYEDEEDDFACGRAYGGSRIAVVSGARYNPILDATQKIERNHAWPASHCKQYMQNCCDTAEEDDEDMMIEDLQVDKDAVKMSRDDAPTPMHAALSAHAALPSLNSMPSTAGLAGLWLGRVCRTAAHELGHCFGIAHCIYYACSMQGTASVIEDSRQPLYLCPVDLAKVLRATGIDQDARYRALLAFCEKYQDAHLFAAYGAWIQARLAG